MNRTGMLFDDTFRTIDKMSQGSYREKASRFLSFAIPVSSEQDIKDQLERIRKKYHDANHHCYAYCLGPDRSAYRVNDDGEPSGSAGKPIYGQLLSKDLTNVLVVVVRYFGGTKLGIPGLINAYRTAAKEALDGARIVEQKVEESYEISFPYPVMNEVMRILKEEGASILQRDSEEHCRICFSVRKSAGFRAYSRLQKISQVHIRLIEK